MSSNLERRQGKRVSIAAEMLGEIRLMEVDRKPGINLKKGKGGRGMRKNRGRGEIEKSENI